MEKPFAKKGFFYYVSIHIKWILDNGYGPNEEMINRKTVLFPLLFLPFVLEAADNVERGEKAKTSTPIVNLSTMVITAMKDDRAVAESGASLAQFDEASIERQNAISLGDVFRYEPGISADEVGGTLSNIRIRGVGDDRVMILVDGAPLPDSYKHGTYLDVGRNYFDIDAMKTIEVVKGPLSTLYGGSAIAGGVFMRTKDPADFLQEGQNIGGEARIGYTTRDRSPVVSGTVAAKFNDQVSAFIRTTYRKFHETQNYHGRAKGEDKNLGPARKRVDAEDGNTRNILAKVVYEPNADNRFSLSYENFNQDASTDLYSYIGRTHHGSYTTFNGHKWHENKRQQINLQHEFIAETPLFDQGSWQVYYQKSEIEQKYQDSRYTIPRPKPPFFEEGGFDRIYRTSALTNHIFGFNVDLSKLVLTDNTTHDLTYGISYRQNRVDSLLQGESYRLGKDGDQDAGSFPNQGFPTSKIQEWGIFLQDRISFGDGQFELIPGVRYDHYKLKPKQGTIYESANVGAPRPESISKGQISARLAFLYHLNDENTFFANYSEGFKAPSYRSVNVGFDNSGFAFPYIYKSNPNLEPEKSRMYEVGWHYNDDKRTASVTAYYTRYKNFIEEQSLISKDPVLTYQDINLGKSYIYGFEAKADVEVAEVLDGRGKVNLMGAFAYAKGKEKDGNKQPITSIDPMKVTLGATYTQDDNLRLGIRWNIVKGKKAKDIGHLQDPMSQVMKDQDHLATPGYATVDIIGEYKPNRRMTINGGIYNVLDKEYWDWGDRMKFTDSEELRRATKPGINAALSIKYDF